MWARLMRALGKANARGNSDGSVVTSTLSLKHLDGLRASSQGCKKRYLSVFCRHWHWPANYSQQSVIKTGRMFLSCLSSSLVKPGKWSLQVDGQGVGTLLLWTESTKVLTGRTKEKAVTRVSIKSKGHRDTPVMEECLHAYGISSGAS